MEANTSPSVCGSTVTTCAWQPRCFSAASTVCTSTAHTAHKSWVRMSSGSSSRNAPASNRYRSWPVATRDRTSASIWPGVNPAGNVEVETMRRDAASGGKSHSKLTPTTSSPAPRAKRISVAEGSNDTIRTTPGYRPPVPSPGCKPVQRNPGLHQSRRPPRPRHQRPARPPPCRGSPISEMRTGQMRQWGVISRSQPPALSGGAVQG